MKNLKQKELKSLEKITGGDQVWNWTSGWTYDSQTGGPIPTYRKDYPIRVRR